MKRLLLILGGMCACLPISHKIYAFVYDVEPSTHICQEYVDYTNSGVENPMTYDQWQNQEDYKSETFWDRLGDQCDAAFNPNWEPSKTYDP